MSILDGGFLVGGDTPNPNPTPNPNAVPIASVPIDNTGTLPIMTLPENYTEYNLLGFTYLEASDTGDAIIPYVLDLNYVKEFESLNIAPDYFAAQIAWDRTARTLTGVDYATFHNASLYTGVGDSSGDGMVTPEPEPEPEPFTGTRLRMGWVDVNLATSVTESLLTVMSDTDSVIIPSYTSNGYLAIWTPDVLGTPTIIRLIGSDVTAVFIHLAELVISGVAGTVRVTDNRYNRFIIPGNPISVSY